MGLGLQLNCESIEKKHVPHEFLDASLRLHNDVSYTGDPPASWSKIWFTVLQKKVRATQVIDCRPIANLGLLYKVFAYLVPGRVENVVDAEQLEEHHGFRAGRRSSFYHFFWTKRKHLEFHFGLSAYICPRHLTGYTGQHFRQPFLSGPHMFCSFEHLVFARWPSSCFVYTSTMSCSTQATFHALGTKRCLSCWQNLKMQSCLPTFGQ